MEDTQSLPTMKKLQVNAPDHHMVSLLWFEAPAATRSMLVLPALGVTAEQYGALAEGLVEHHISVCVLEYRGHGINEQRPNRDNNWGFAELLSDIDVAMHWLNKKAPELPCVLAGHSLGGHLATLYAGMRPLALAAVVHLAVSSPFYDDYPPKQSRQISILCKLIPWFRFYPGYYPGERLGFGGTEALGVMNDWADWARSGTFDFGKKRGLSADVAKYKGPLMVVNFDRDNYVSPKGIRRAIAPFTNAKINRVQMGPAEQGAYLGHFSWTRNPEGVVWALWHWLQEGVPTEVTTTQTDHEPT